MRGLQTTLLILTLSAWSVSGAAVGFTITSQSYPEGSLIPVRYGADICGGGGISPQVAWSGWPAGTRSLVVLMIDADGANGLTVPHWLVYNIAPTRTHLEEGEAQHPAPGLTLGKNVSGNMAYRGMCPPVGDTAHHYYISVIATDLSVGSLPSGLTREALDAALRGHALVGQSYFGFYRR